MSNVINFSNRDFEKIAITASNFVNDGGIIIVPFDTVYGLIADPKNSAALKHLFRIKNRPENKPIGISVDSLNSIDKYATLQHEEYIRARTPGPFTFILPVKHKVLAPVCYFGETVAIRIPDNDLVREIAKRCGAIAQTSANKSGQLPSTNLSAVTAQFSKDDLSHISMIILNDSAANGKPSTIIDLTGKFPLEIER